MRARGEHVLVEVGVALGGMPLEHGGELLGRLVVGLGRGPGVTGVEHRRRDAGTVERDVHVQALIVLVATGIEVSR